MKPKWIIDHLLTDGNEQKLEKAIKAQGMECIKTKYIPFSFLNEDLKDQVQGQNIVLYGTLEFCRQINEQLLPVPGAYLKKNNLKFSTYACYYYDYLMNKDFYIKPFGVIRKELSVGNPNYIFIRPNDVTKEFAGQVVNNVKELEYINRMELISDETLCVVSSPKEILEETRFVVVNGKAIAGSRYMLNGKLNIDSVYDPLAESFLDHMLFDVPNWTPDTVFVADVALYKEYPNYSTETKYGLIEINSFSCAGLYACDLDEVAKYVSGAAADEFDLSY